MSELNLVLAVGRDGFMARSPEDNMQWTGAMDKSIFKLLTSVGQVVGMSNRSADLLPSKGLVGRTVVRLSRSGLTLSGFAENYPGAWLGSGYNLTQQALAQDYVRSVFICHLDRDCCGPKGRAAYPQAMEDPTRRYITGMTGAQRGWHLEHTIHLGDVAVAVHRRG